MIYDQMPEPKWVISMGVCASTGGFYRAYHVMQGIDEIIPVDVYVPGCPPAPESLLAAVMRIQDLIKSGKQQKLPQRAAHLGSNGEAVNDRRLRRQAWAREDAERGGAQACPRRACSRSRPPRSARRRSAVVASGPLAASAELLARPPARVLRQALGERVLEVTDFRGDLAIRVERGAWVEAARLLRDHPDLDFRLFLDLCAVDYLDRDDAAARFEVVLHLYSVSRKHHVRLKTPVPERDPRLPTIAPLFLGANWFEREAWDLYGIVFEGHPNLTRILTHDAFVGHPMRKDYPVGKRHVLHAPRERLLQVPEGTEGIVVNIGPSHPSMHGAFRVQALLDGETIADAEAELGYMHRNFEKMAESRSYWQIIPYTDRLNYCSSFMNGHGWALAVEKLLGVPAPAAGRGDPRDSLGVLSDHGPPRLHLDERGRSGGDHALLRDVPCPGSRVRPARGLLRRAAHGLLRQDRRSRRRRARGLRGPLPGDARILSGSLGRRAPAAHAQHDRA